MDSFLTVLTFVLNLQTSGLHHFLHQSVPRLTLSSSLLVSLGPDFLQGLLHQLLDLLLLLLPFLQLIGEVLQVPLLVLSQLSLSVHTKMATTQHSHVG